MASPPPALKHVSVNGTTLAYREFGQGEPMVLVHGHISDHRTWTQLESLLATKYHVYSYSKRFAWPNDPIPDGEPQSWEQDSLDLAALIETLDIGPVHALGNSSGATNIVYLSRTHPHLFRTLLLEEPPLVTLFLPTLPPPLLSTLTFLLRHPISFWPVTIYAATTLDPAMTLAQQGDDAAALEKFGSGCLGPQHWAESRADPARKQQTDDNARWLCSFFRGGARLPTYVAADAAKLTIPTLVLTGEEGPYFQQCVDAELLRVCGASRKSEVKIPRAGHLVHEGNAEAVFEAVVRFLQE